MTTIAENNKRIAKNTVVLYFRMFFIMAITFVTSREVIRILGVEDYGIYTVIASVIVLFSFVNGAMVSATQRFLNFSIGKNDFEEANRVFSTSLTIYLILIFVIVFLGETVGYILYKRLIVIPNERKDIADWVYHTSVIALALNFLKTPYNAAVLAFEKMSVYATLSIIDVLLKLVIIWIVLLFPFDHLLSYSILFCIAVLLVDVLYWLYCRNKFSVCKYVFFWDKKLFKELTSFSGWSLLGSASSIGVSQGSGVLVNVFFGVLVNAAMGVSNQVLSAIYSFSASFQTAFNPQIVKYYAQGNFEEFRKMIYNTSRYSYFLLLIISIPVYFLCSELLSIWLDVVPEYSVEFTKIVIVFSLIEGITAPLWMAIYATGKVRDYQVVVSIVMLSILPISYILFKVGFSPTTFFILRLITSSFLWIYRVQYIHKFMKFTIKPYYLHVFIPCMIVTVLALVISCFVYFFVTKNIIFFSFLSLVITGLSIYVLGMNKVERIQIKTTFIKRLRRG